MVTLLLSDSDPKETFVNHQAGLDGHGGSSYIDLVICRNKDANTAWTTASDGTLEERVYYCQNYHADVSAFVTSAGTLIEWDKYFAYGTPFGLIGGDTNSDGDCDAADVTQIQSWIDAPAYDVRGDIDLDGDVDATDKSTIVGSYQGITLGRGQLTRVRNRKGTAGYEYLPEIGDKCLVRKRVLAGDTGAWLARDPFDYADGSSLVQYCNSRPVIKADFLGLLSVVPQPPATRTMKGDCAPSIGYSGNPNGWGIYIEILSNGTVLPDCPGDCRLRVEAHAAYKGKVPVSTPNDPTNPLNVAYVAWHGPSQPTDNSTAAVDPPLQNASGSGTNPSPVDGSQQLGYTPGMKCPSTPMAYTFTFTPSTSGTAATTITATVLLGCTCSPNPAP